MLLFFFLSFMSQISIMIYLIWSTKSWVHDIQFTFPTPSSDFDEVWGMDNKDFYDSSDEMVCLGDVLWIW